MAETKPFAPSVILTITQTRLLCDMRAVHEICDWMTGDSNFTHQLPRVADECKPWLEKWFPELAAVAVPELEKPDDYARWAAKIDDRFGACYVQRMPAGAHAGRDPIAEAAEMMGSRKGARHG